MDLNFYENRHNLKFPETPVKIIEKVGNYLYFETEFGLCRKLYVSFYYNSYDIRSALNKTNFFINQSNKLHSFKYDYSKTEYISAKNKVIITCKIHGDFLITPNKHLFGRGCEKCGRNATTDFQRINAVGWTLEAWEKLAKSSKYFESFKVYILKCWNENEEFYKIGRTFSTIKRRFESKGHIPYKYEILYIYSNEAKYIYNLEVKLKQINKEYKYTPLLDFDGKHECFSKLKELKQNFWEELLNPTKTKNG